MSHETIGPKLRLSVLADVYAICKLDALAEPPAWVQAHEFLSVTRTPEELSIVCRQSDVPDGITCSRDWRTLKIAGPLDFSMIGILAELCGALAEARISVFTVSTYETDYLFVREGDLQQAVEALRQRGHVIED